MLQLQDKPQLRDAWTAFWQTPASGTQCIRGAPDITHVLHDRWASFAAPLGASAHVLDLGCGAGAAARALVAARADLRVTGIDFASVPQAGDARITLLSATPMESPPFADACFDAVVSQFGFEYGRTHKIARQMARVLVPGGRFSLIVHHAESSVVAVNRARLDLLCAAAQMQAAFLAGDGPALSRMLAALLREHAGDPLALKLAQLLPQRVHDGGRQRHAAWHALEAALFAERTILESLDACCVAPEELEGWLGPLRQFFTGVLATVLRKPDGAPIAWRIDGAQGCQQGSALLGGCSA